ncbi:hypothetical protein, partial [Lactobacillus delbrueckii]|uniref:hypothetical protein n=1 Tax=Lactobacillus delbrueckii TaxID=1584 RepID=UPI001E54E256
RASGSYPGGRGFDPPRRYKQTTTWSWFFVFVYSLIFSIFSENFFPKKACIDRELLYTSKRAYEKARWSSG